MPLAMSQWWCLRDCRNHVHLVIEIGLDSFFGVPAPPASLPSAAVHLLMGTSGLLNVQTVSVVARVLADRCNSAADQST